MAEDDKELETPKATPPETPPPIITSVQRREGRQWLMLLVYLLIALVVAGLVVLGGRWVYNQVRDDRPAEVANNDSDRTPEAPAPSPQPTPSPQESTPPPSTTPPSSSTERDEISNTGPSGVVVLFITATIVAAGLHYILSLRRAD